MGKVRDSDHTKAKILHAASREFVQHGFDGASLADIARRARASKQLILHHFTSKEGLFHAVLDVKFRAALQAADPQLEDSTTIIAERFRRRAGYVDYIRFLTWEAASGRTNHIPAHAVRQKRIAEFGAAIRKLHATGQFPAELDPAMLQLAILALATYPMAFGQITQLVTGKLPTDPGFQRDWYDFLQIVGRRLLGAQEKDYSVRAAKRPRTRT